jgi:hypothetical protein
MVDPEGQHHVLFKGIVNRRYADHQRDTTYIKEAGNHQPRARTLGWDICLQWDDGTPSWLPLTDLRESNPVEVSGYAVF